MTAATWTTREGLTVPIRRMTDQHLRNTILYLRRNAATMLSVAIQNAYAFEGCLQGEMAIDAAERGIDEMEELSPGEYLRENTPYETMLWHAKRRKLNIEPWEEDDE